MLSSMNGLTYKELEKTTQLYLLCCLYFKGENYMLILGGWDSSAIRSFCKVQSV